MCWAARVPCSLLPCTVVQSYPVIRNARITRPAMLPSADGAPAPVDVPVDCHPMGLESVRNGGSSQGDSTRLSSAPLVRRRRPPSRRSPAFTALARGRRGVIGRVARRSSRRDWSRRSTGASARRTRDRRQGSSACRARGGGRRRPRQRYSSRSGSCTATLGSRSSRRCEPCQVALELFELLEHEAGQRRVEALAPPRIGTGSADPIPRGEDAPSRGALPPAAGAGRGDHRAPRCYAGRARGSTGARRSSAQRAAVHTAMAHRAPSTQPASTSVGQCTPT